MLKITDKSFRYTPSFNTDLRKKFKKMEQERRAFETRSKDTEADLGHSVVPMLSRRVLTKS